MYTPQDIYKALDEIMPFASQEPWDNSGLLINCENSVDKVLICLDITRQAALYGAQNGFDLIVSHHPIIFTGLKSLSANAAPALLIKNNISAICAHTNYDNYEKGTGFVLTQKLLFDKKVEKIGFSFLVTLKEPKTAFEIAKALKPEFNGAIELTVPEKLVKKVLVVPGAGGDLAKEALELGADCLLTGECKYHDKLDLANENISTITLGHDVSEGISLKSLADLIQGRFKDIRVEIFTPKPLTTQI